MGRDYRAKGSVKNSSFNPLSPSEDIFDSNEELVEYAERVHEVTENVLDDYDLNIEDLDGELTSQNGCVAESVEEAKAFDRLGYEPKWADFYIIDADRHREPENEWGYATSLGEDISGVIRYKTRFFDSESFEVSISIDDRNSATIAAEIQEGVEEVLDELEQ